jgi:hypothetical protein
MKPQKNEGSGAKPYAAARCGSQMTMGCEFFSYYFIKVCYNRLFLIISIVSLPIINVSEKCLKIPKKTVPRACETLWIGRPWGIIELFEMIWIVYIKQGLSIN